jgi:hypothetical protein
MGTFLEVALRNAARGFRVIPLRGKDAFLHEWPALATTDETTIRQWTAQYADYNCGACGGSDIIMLDTDRLSRLQEICGAAWAEWSRTYSVSSGRPNRAHFYYLATDEVLAFGNKRWKEDGQDGNIFEIKGRGALVVAEGSIHPDTGGIYRITQDLPLIPFPSGLFAVLKDHWSRQNPTGKREWNLPVHDGEGRDDFLISQAGKLRHVGCSEDIILAHLEEINSDPAIMADPKSDDDLKRIARSAARYDVPAECGTVTIGEEKKVTDWRTHYHTVEEHDRVEPPSFLIEGFLPVQAIMGIGAFVGQKKTLVALNIAFSLCSGELLFGKYKVKQQPARVLYLGPENGLISFSDRVNRIGLRDYLGQTFFYATMSMPEQTRLGALTPEEIMGAAIIIDTAIRFTDGNENDATHMKEFAKQAFSLIRDKAACVIMLHHSPKGMTKTAEMTLENSFRGTGELSAFLSVALAMRTQDMDNEYDSASLLRFVKQRDFEPKPSSFEVKTSRETCQMTFVDGSGGAVVKLGNTANKDGKDDAAVALMKAKANQQLSNVKMAKLLMASGIDRSKEWVRLKRGELGIGGLKVGSTL